MPLKYLSSSARLRQLERLVHQHPGATVVQLMEWTNQSYPSVCAYMHRLCLEQRVTVEPEPKRGELQKFYGSKHDR